MFGIEVWSLRGHLDAKSLRPLPACGEGSGEGHQKIDDPQMIYSAANSVMSQTCVRWGFPL